MWTRRLVTGERPESADEAGEVVADAGELGTLLEHLESAGLHADTVQRVPAADDPLFVGLS